MAEQASATGGPMGALVTTEWLAQRLSAADLRVVDASWYLPSMHRDAEAEYLAGHIPGAVFIDLDRSSDAGSALPHMLPPPAAFAERMSTLGLGDEHRIVVYDGSGVNLSAPRVWWMLRAYGHARVAVLDGGLARWRAEGRPLERGRIGHPPASFTPRLDPARLRTLADVARNVDLRAEQVVDTRPAGRFEGTEPEPRAGMRSGHIPGSRNVPFGELVREDGTMPSAGELAELLAARGVDPRAPTIATCGSGTSACSLILALHLIGNEAVSLYDGSWSEWGAAPDVPVATGAAGG